MGWPIGRRSSAAAVVMMVGLAGCSAGASGEAPQTASPPPSNDATTSADGVTAQPLSPSAPPLPLIASLAGHGRGGVVGPVPGRPALEVHLWCTAGRVHLRLPDQLDARSTCVPTGDVLRFDALPAPASGPLSVTLDSEHDWRVEVYAATG